MTDKVSIPRLPSGTKHGTARLTSPTPQGERPAGGYTVLVVDDEEAVRRLAVRMLTWTGYQAIEARHGREALAAIEQHSGPVHLVLTDIKMPGMNGRELGRFVEQRWPGKPILYMSGFASEVFQGGLLEPGRAVPGQAVHPGGSGRKGAEPARGRRVSAARNQFSTSISLPHLGVRRVFRLAPLWWPCTWRRIPGS